MSFQQMESIMYALIRPLVITGIYKDETVAIKGLLINHIESKIEYYDEIIQALEKKYEKNFNTYTRDIKNKATPILEDDWLEWKGAADMKEAWKKSLKEVIESEAKV